jgi:hypothetical protein
VGQPAQTPPAMQPNAAAPPAQPDANAPPADAPQSLEQNVKAQNSFFQQKQIDRLQQRYGPANQSNGVQVQGVK